MGSKVIHVAVGVIKRHGGYVFVTKRAPDVHQGGVWEFPGGKIEPGESPQEAINRELKEELGINVEEARPLIKFNHDYPDRSVLLDVWLVNKWRGDISGQEDQEHKWIHTSDLETIEFPAANHLIIKSIRLPSLYLICPKPEVNIEDYLGKVEVCLKHGIRLLQLRCGEEVIKQKPYFIKEILSLCNKNESILLLNSTPEQALYHNFHGVHLSSKRLLSLNKRPLGKEYYVAASCHNLEELAHACNINIDFAVLSPVEKTSSHPEVVPLGWDKFSTLVEGATVPVYALGGMHPKHMMAAWEHGAQGLAVLSSVWLADAPEDVIRQYIARS